MIIELTREAVSTATSEQKLAIFNLVKSEQTLKVVVQLGGFDLPTNYLTFRKDYLDGVTSIYGGIAPDGSVST